MKKCFLLLIAFVFIISSCLDKTATPDDNKFIQLDEKSAQLIEADNKFGLELFQKVNASSEEENIMISPLSISVALAMAYNGADGDTKTEMEQTLKLFGLTTEEINASYEFLISALKSLDEDVVFEIANAVFYDEGFPVKNDFVQVLQEVYDAEVSEIDFALPASLDAINNWVAEKTHDKIPTILDQLNPLDVMVLLNAIYFNGIWKTEFNEDGTHDLSFYKSDGTTTVIPMMNKEDSVAYVANDLFKAVKMPYGNGQYNMVVFLPEEGKTSEDVIESFSADNWEQWMESFEIHGHVVITMPRFKYSFEIQLNDVLAEMGMVKAFSDTEADFSKISDIFIYISSVIHKSFIDVNETGTEAAAVTAVTFTVTSAGPNGPEKIHFTVDKPFVYAITEEDTGAILFIGEVKNPEYN